MRLFHKRFQRSVLPMQTNVTFNSRGVAWPLLVAAPMTLAAGWVIRAGLARIFRARVLTTARSAPRPFDTRPAPLPTDEELDREEVVRALLESGRDRFDELGRSVHLPGAGRADGSRGPPTRSAPRRRIAGRHLARSRGPHLAPEG